MHPHPVVWVIMKAQAICSGDVIYTNVVGIADTEADELSTLELLVGSVLYPVDLFNPLNFCHTG